MRDRELAAAHVPLRARHERCITDLAPWIYQRVAKGTPAVSCRFASHRLSRYE